MAREDIAESLSLLDDQLEVSLDQLARLSGLRPAAIRTLAEAGLLEVRVGHRARLCFSARSIEVARRASRLRADFELNPSGLMLALSLLERIDSLEARLKELECRMLR